MSPARIFLRECNWPQRWLGALIALAAHGGKTAIRAAVTPSPEPFSNMALSFGEDVGAITLTWAAAQHPYIAASIVLVLLVVVIFMMRWVIRALRGLFNRIEPWWREQFVVSRR